MPISVSIGLRWGTGEDDFGIYREYGIFPGTLREGINEVTPRITALMTRAPMPENLRGRTFQDEFGISDHLMNKAFKYIAAGRYIAGFDWHKRAKEIFDKWIWTDIIKRNPEADRVAAIDLYWKQINPTFGHMEKWRGKNFDET